MNFNSNNYSGDYSNKETSAFDAFFQQKLSQHDAPLPNDMFDRIMQARDKREKIVGFWQQSRAWFVAAGLVVAVSVAGFWQWQKV
ncbi:MAG: hypothetical protein HC817_10295 [Saprospiraceae bacterium]|nr:hypothetical protein [Saprospiraceae bacterium]